MKLTKSFRFTASSNPDTKNTGSASDPALLNRLLETALAMLNASSILALLWLTEWTIAQPLPSSENWSDRFCKTTVSHIIHHDLKKEKRYVQPD